MNTGQTNQFRVSSNAQDRIKLPHVFWAGLRSIGLSPGAILRRSNLPPTVYSGESLVTTGQMFSIWRAIRELCKDPTMGWKFMKLVETDQYHPTLLAAMHARTYGESLERLARYKKLCSIEEFCFTKKRDEFLVEVSWPFAGEESPPALLIDAVFALVMELGRRGTKTKLKPKRVELARPAEREDGLEGYFGCPVKYRASRNALVLHATDAELLFATHNDELLEMLEPQFEKKLKQGQTRRAFLSR